MVGHIKIDRKILNWEWYSDYKMVHLFIHLLIKANYKENTWQGVKIKRGQLITGLHKLSGATGLSVSQTRTCLNKLQTTGEIATEMTNKYTIITICKYDVYQSEKPDNRKQDSNQIDKQVSNQDSKQVSNTIRKQEDKKLFINMPTPECFNGLSEIRVGAAIELLRITKYVDVSKEDILGLWEVFKIQNLTGKKYFEDEDAVYGYFFNWVKDKRFDVKKVINQSKSNKNSWM